MSCCLRLRIIPIHSSSMSHLCLLVATISPSTSEVTTYEVRSFVAIPSVIGKLPDDREHRVVCDEYGNNKKRFSKSVELKNPSDWGEITEEGFARRPIRTKKVIPQEAVHQGSSETQSPTTVREQLIDFTYKVISVLEESTKMGLRAYRSEAGIPNLQFYLKGLDPDPVGTAQKVSRILLGAELFIFSDEPQSRETPRSLPLDSSS